MLRKSDMLDALISRTKQQILAATLLQPQRSWYLVELARHLHLQPSSLQRELKLLSEAGILTRRRNGNRVYFQPDTACPILPELGQILFKTVGVVEALKGALRPLQNQIDIAFVYGSIATGSERSTSDIDLIVIGSAPLSATAPLLRNLERRIGRPINPTVYARHEFVKRLQQGSHFLKNILRNEPLYIMGGQDELAKLAASATSETTSDKRARARRSAKRR